MLLSKATFSKMELFAIKQWHIKHNFVTLKECYTVRMRNIFLRMSKLCFRRIYPYKFLVVHVTQYPLYFPCRRNGKIFNSRLAAALTFLRVRETLKTQPINWITILRILPVWFSFDLLFHTLPSASASSWPLVMHMLRLFNLLRTPDFPHMPHLDRHLPPLHTSYSPYISAYIAPLMNVVEFRLHIVTVYP